MGGRFPVADLEDSLLLTTRLRIWEASKETGS